MLKLSSCQDSICKLEFFVQRVTEEYGISKDRYPDILISLTEAVNNAIIHGNQENQQKNVLINHSYRDKEGLTFKISDEGRGFDHQNLADPTRVENIECCGGRGVFLIKQLSDRVRFVDNGRTVIINFDV